jgi:YesN/AraC family two-component response regulator
MLLVDDDHGMLELVRTMIEGSFRGRVSVAVAEDALVARRIIENTPVDIVITDLEMPGVSGLEIVRAAKRRNVHTQVLMLTGHSTVSAVLDAMDLGATDYILKPLDRDEFITVLTETIHRLERWRRVLGDTCAASSHGGKKAQLAGA